MTFRYISKFLWLLSLLLALPAAAFEVFRAATPSIGSISDERPVAVGPTWAAYVETLTQITVIDTATRAVIHTIPRPADRTPIPGQPGWVRSVTIFGQQLITDGTYLVALSDSALEQLAPNGAVLQTKKNFTVHAWKMPGAQSIGIVDIDEYPSANSAFLGVGNGRINYWRSRVQNIRQWNAETLTPLTGIPVLRDSTDVGSVAMSGNDLVYVGRDALSINHLYHLNLTSGSVNELPKPAGLETGSFQNLAVSSGHLLAPGVRYPPGTATPMFHYNLSTRQVVAQTETPGGKSTQPFFAPDGSWRAVSVGFNGATAEMRSGSAPTVAGSAVFELPRGFDSTGVIPDPFAYAQGHLWFRAGGVPDGTVAYRIPAAVQPISRLAGRCLPADESDGHLKVVFTLDPVVNRELVLQVRTQSGAGSATAGSDFESFDGEVTIPAGASQAALQLPLIQDSVVEENETLVVEITSHPADILVSEKEVPGIIGGSSFHRLPPVAGWQDLPALSAVAVPDTIALAGDRLVQTNRGHSGPTGAVPSVLTRPLEGGEWTPSTAFAAAPFDSYGISTNGSGLALVASPSAVRLFDPATDTLLYQTPGSPGLVPNVLMGDTHFMVGAPYVTEYSLTPPYASRRPVASLSGNLTGSAVYANEVLIGHFLGLPGGGLHKISRANQADLGQFIPGSAWYPTHMAASGNFFAGSGIRGVWFRRVDEPGRLIRVRPANGPFSLRIRELRITGNRLWVTEALDEDVPSIRVFEMPSGLETGRLLGDGGDGDANFSPYLPEGIAPLGREPSSGDQNDLEDLSFGGKDIVAAIRWPELGSNHLVAARFVQEAGLPGIVDSAPIREDAGDMMLTLSEAAPWPLTITTRAVAALHNQAADWSGSGNTVVIPAGTTTFSPGVRPFNDKLPEGNVASPLELTITGNGLTRTSRIAMQVEDDDQMPLADVPHTLHGFGRGIAPVAGEWAYRADSADENLVAWTGSAAFTHGSPFGTSGSRAFGNAMAGTGTWLAVAHDAWGGTAKGAKPSQIQIYQPATRGKTPVRVLKGMKYFNGFGETLFARDTTLWVGAPGSSLISPKPKKTAGMVLQYDLPTGKKRRTFKAPKTHAIGFGSSITANATSVWIGSPVSGGAVFQYDRAKGKLLRTLVNPASGAEQIFGTTIEANARTLAANSTYPNTLPQPLRGYSAATGVLQWQLHPPAGRHIGSFTLIGEDLLVTGGDSLIFFYLPPTGAPELLVEVLMPGGADDEIVELKAASGELALRCTRNGHSIEDGLVLTLAGVPKLAPYLPGALAATAMARVEAVESTAATPPALTLGQTLGGAWQLNLPAAASGTSVEFSTDLTQWHSLATAGSEGSWQLVPGTGAGTTLEGASLIDRVSLRVPPNHSRLFFRLHTP
ncbi:hypothetical protein OKA05_20700 [Luteolibacter arcticus]|uniref:Calx-beta domain-containing protein n=1 Tax=Luteolibacter arcticus TaxID=1581411 RepID=A0ABT3GNF4_9BACT|nr:Calx-beta domain-containing protein [Luteolibacter arcticus]MCW1924995.1 hypothetical protein [Luteolibacter arcticus]